jgi:hypothetical protein
LIVKKIEQKRAKIGAFLFHSFSLFQSNISQNISDALNPVLPTHTSGSANEIDDGPATHHAGKVKRVPIGEADAPVRFSLADFFRGCRNSAPRECRRAHSVTEMPPKPF